jgi:hypothetical protein
MRRVGSPDIVYTAGPPGHERVNEQPLTYWIDQFERFEAAYDGAAPGGFVGALRANGVSSFWMSANASVFRSADAAGTGESAG